MPEINKKECFETPQSGIDNYIQTLSKLLTSQFAKIVFLSAVDSSKLPGETAPLRIRSEALVRLYAQQHNGDMSGLKNLIIQNAPGLADSLNEK